MKPKLIAVLVTGALALIVLVQNTHVVGVKLLFWKLEMSQVILILLVLAIGFVAGFLVAKLPGGARH